MIIIIDIILITLMIIVMIVLIIIIIINLLVSKLLRRGHLLGKQLPPMLIACKFFSTREAPPPRPMLQYCLHCSKGAGVGGQRLWNKNKIAMLIDCEFVSVTQLLSWQTRKKNNGRGWSGVESLLSEAQQACSLLRHLVKKKQLRCESDDQSPKVSTTTRFCKKMRWL